MSAERLREAARLMRERANDAYAAVDDGDWRFDNIGWFEGLGTTYTVENNTMSVCEAVLEEPAVHIASWHPHVALLVARWLEAESHVPEQDIGEGITLGGPSLEALAVANAYLGGA